jgi:hypothetical protein
MSLNNTDIYQRVSLTIDVSTITKCKRSRLNGTQAVLAVSHLLVMKRFISACNSQVKHVHSEDKADQEKRNW